MLHDHGVEGGLRGVEVQIPRREYETMQFDSKGTKEWYPPPTATRMTPELDSPSGKQQQNDKRS
jgi:hypothetical protein